AHLDAALAHVDLDRVPAPIALEGGRVTEEILTTELLRQTGRGFVEVLETFDHLGAAARFLGDLAERPGGDTAAAAETHRVAAKAADPDPQAGDRGVVIDGQGVDQYLEFVNPILQLLDWNAALVVLAIRQYQQRFLGVETLGNEGQRHRNRIVDRRSA